MSEPVIIVQPTAQTVQATAGGGGGGAVTIAPATQRVIAATPPPVIVEAAPVAIREPTAEAAMMVVQAESREVIRAGGALQGPPGPPGPTGPPGDVTFVFTQAVPSAAWDVTHGLGRYPSVTVVDSGGQQVIGNVQYVSPGRLTITFALPFAGTAYLN